MVFKKTSEEGFVFPRSERPKGAILADFDIDGDILKRRHFEWLDDNVINPAHAKSSTAGGWTIDLIGRASKSGSDQHNLWLSDKRVRAVMAYLGPKMSGVPFLFRPSQLGESSPFDSTEFEHELDRSVEIRSVFTPTMPPRRIKPHIHIPKVIPWKRPVNRKVMDFKLQVLKAEISIRTLDVKFPFISVGNGDARVKMLIDIRELGSTDHAMFEFRGAGPGTIVSAKPSWKKAIPGFGFSSWSSLYEKGNVHSFATEVEMDADDFQGPALFQFDLLGRTFAFGPKPSFWGSQEKIKNLSFGLTTDTNLLEYAEATVSGKMSVVESVPSWAA